MSIVMERPVLTRDRVSKAAPVWLAGAGLGALILGPALAPGALLNLDLVLTPRLPLSPGLWGLGPEIPRTVPFGALLSFSAALLGGPVVGKLVIFLSVAAAFVGMHRLAATAGQLPALGAAALYAANPFVLTRIGVGHLSMVAGVALLPWAAPKLLEPRVALRRTFLWSLAFGVLGVYGGLMALSCVVAGLLVQRGPWARPLSCAAAGQLPWLVPTGIVYLGAPRIQNGSAFTTTTHSVGDAFELLAGHGFWQSGYQVGNGQGAVVPLVGASLAALAWYGHRQLPNEWGRAATLLAVVTVALVLWPSVPGLRTFFVTLTDTPLGAGIREVQRLLPLYLVWLAPAAACGAARAGRAVQIGTALRAAPAVLAIVLATPGMWGVGGELRIVDFPSDWSDAAALVQHEPGTTLALPWHRYLNLDFAGGRRVLNPVPQFFGGDVITASDLELGDDDHERLDSRESRVSAALANLGNRQSVSDQFAQLGIRWVVLLHEVHYQAYLSLLEDPGFDVVMSTSSLDLLRVKAWPGDAIDTAGHSVTVQSPIPPIRLVGSGDATTIFQSWSPGWVRGLSGFGIDANGLLQLPSGMRVVWYWPSLLVVTTYTVVSVFAVRTVRAELSAKRRRQC